MSHIHLPDGVIPPFWWITGLILCLALLWIFAGRIKKDEVRRKIPFAGVIGALMLIFMSVPLGILPVHLNLAVLCGILAGPGLGFVAVFAVNTILALIGHGGFTVIGLNTLLMGGEAILGYYIFRAASGRLGSASSAVTANILALLLSTVLMILIVGTSVGLGEALLPHDHTHESVHAGEDHIDDRENNSESHSGEIKDARFLFLTGWTAVIAVILAGILLESLVTGLIVSFFSKVRPDLLKPAAEG
ncbi:MAG: energy-coupling factor ABC transporter permease [Caldicoprobacterales bacterium]|jgi:cobalt/nickel transport system permease protein|nr:energy-coupling factor ABC transporter permease [Clostridiales bacterium]